MRGGMFWRFIRKCVRLRVHRFVWMCGVVMEKLTFSLISVRHCEDKWEEHGAELLNRASNEVLLLAIYGTVKEALRGYLDNLSVGKLNS